MALIVPQEDASVWLQRAVKLELRRCYRCGHWWGSESASEPTTCASCLRGELSSKNDGMLKLQRTIRALRGALTRKRKP